MLDFIVVLLVIEFGDWVGIGGVVNDGLVIGFLVLEDKLECVGERFWDIVVRFICFVVGDDGCFICYSGIFIIYIGKVWDVGCVSVKENNSFLK